MKPDKSALRKFGITFAIILLFISLIQFKKYNFTLSYWLGTIAGVILMASIIAPIITLPIYVIIHAISRVIGWINTRILLSIVFFIIFTPTGLILKLFRKNLLYKRIDKDAASYWTKAEEELDAENFQKQY